MPPRGYHLFDVHLPDELGALARLARTLAEAKVNIEGFVANRGGVQVLTHEPTKAEKALKQAAYHFRIVPVREVTLEEKPGSLANLSEKLAWDWTSIEAGFGLATGKTARVFLEVKAEPPADPPSGTTKRKAVPTARAGSPRKAQRTT